MKLPHVIRYDSRVPVLLGRLFIGRPFAAWTAGVWTFVPGRLLSAQIVTHEYRHVQQFAVLWVAALGLWSLLTPSWWWLLATPLAHGAAVGLAGLYAWTRGGHPYRDNWFERDARRYAGES